MVQGSGPRLERLRKQVFSLFNNLGLKVTIDTNIKKCDFLDVYLDLNTGLHKPFRKANQKPIYVHKDSNHPESIKRQIPKMVATRLTNLSSNEAVFLSEIDAYREAMNSSGYSEPLIYQHDETNNGKRRNRCRTKKVVWFNPPFCQSVKTNIGTKFLALIDKHFKDTSLAKHFNRSTLKISYSCLPNLERIISGHNKRILVAEAQKSSAREPPLIPM